MTARPAAATTPPPDHRAQQTQQARVGLLYLIADLRDLAARCPAQAETLTALAEVTACLAQAMGDD